MERQTITVDIAPGNNQIQRLKSSQGDIGRPLGVYITQNGVALDCSAYTADLYILKPDGNYFTATATVDATEHNLITWETAKQETPVAGDCAAQIRILSNGDDVGTARFVEYVEASPGFVGESSESVVESLMEYVRQAAASAETASGAASSATGSASAASGSASSAAQSASAAAGSASTAHTDAETASQAAQTAQDVAASIPEDYSTLSEDVTGLKSALNYHFVQGNIYNIFEYNTEPNRIRNYGVLDYGFGLVTIEPAEGTEVYIAIWDDEYNRLSYIGWTPNKSSFYTSPNKSKFTIAVKKSDNSALTPIPEYIPNIRFESSDSDIIRDKLIHLNTKIHEGNIKGKVVSNHLTSDYLPCKEGDSIKCSFFAASGGRNILAVYDKYLNLIYSVPAQGQNTMVPFDYTFQQGSAYFTVTFHTAVFANGPVSDFKYTVLNDPYVDMEEHEEAFNKNTNYEIVPIDAINFSKASFSYQNPQSWWTSTNVCGVIDCRKYCRLEVYSKSGNNQFLVAPALSAETFTRRSIPIRSENMYIKINAITGTTGSVEEVAEDIVIIGYFKEQHNDLIVSTNNANGLSFEYLMNQPRKAVALDGGTDANNNFYASEFLPCVSGDMIQISGTIATSYRWLATFDKDGYLVTVERGAGTTDVNDLVHTFTDAEKYFIVSIPTAQQIFVRYLSKFKFEPDTKLPVMFENELKQIDSRLTAKISEASESIPLVFGFSTDQHYTPRILLHEYIKYGAYALAKIAKMQPLDSIVLGGDIASYVDSYTVETIMEDIGKYVSYYDDADVPVISLSGNHDSFQNNENVTPQNMFTAHFKKPVNDHVFTKYHPLGTNGYIDYDFIKVRMVFVDTHPRKDMTSALCAEWLQDAFNTLPDGWTTIVVGHIPILTSLPTPPFYNAIDTYNQIIISNKDKIDFLLFGHSHRDAVYVSDEGLNVVATTCALGESRYDSAPYTAKMTAFDVFVYDKVNHVLNGVRFGNGYDRKIMLTGNIVTVTYNLTNATTLNNTTMRMREGDSFDDLLKGTIGNVTVTMGGEDITSTAYASGKISIPAITGNVVITES